MQQKMNNQPIMWKMRNGKLIDIDKMDINHLRNTLKMIVKNSNKNRKERNIILNDDCDATEFDLY